MNTPDTERLYELNDYLTTFARRHGLMSDLSDDEQDERLNEATHTVWHTLTMKERS